MMGPPEGIRVLAFTKVTAGFLRAPMAGDRVGEGHQRSLKSFIGLPGRDGCR